MAASTPIMLFEAGYGSLAETDPVAGAVAGAPLLTHTPGATPTGVNDHQLHGCKQWFKHAWRCIDGEMTWLGAHELAGSALNMYAATRKRAFALASLVVVFRGIGQGAECRVHTVLSSGRVRLISYLTHRAKQSLVATRAVVFMNNPLSGLLIFLGLLVQSPFTAVCGLWATMAATWVRCKTRTL